MADISLQSIASDIQFNLVTGKEISDQVRAIYEMGYKDGKSDQKKITMRIKFRYSILLDWMFDQLFQFSIYTKRSEYKDILKWINMIADDYMAENRLLSKYNSRRYKAVFEDGKAPEECNTKDELAYLLVDVMGNFQREEERKASMNLKQQ